MEKRLGVMRKKSARQGLEVLVRPETHLPRRFESTRAPTTLLTHQRDFSASAIIELDRRDLNLTLLRLYRPPA